jgi:hypothetical protein
MFPGSDATASTVGIYKGFDPISFHNKASRRKQNYREGCKHEAASRP